MMKFFGSFIVQIAIVLGAVILLTLGLQMTGHLPPRYATDRSLLVELSLGVGIAIGLAGTAWRLVRYIRQSRRNSG